MLLPKQQAKQRVVDQFNLPFSAFYAENKQLFTEQIKTIRRLGKLHYPYILLVKPPEILLFARSDIPVQDLKKLCQDLKNMESLDEIPKIIRHVSQYILNKKEFDYFSLR